MQLAVQPYPPNSVGVEHEWLTQGETDAEGRWNADLSDPAKSLRARITADGYSPGEWRFDRDQDLECRLAFAITVRGRVLDRHTGVALAGANVATLTVDRQVKTADALGRYELTRLPAGEALQIWAVADDYAEAEHGFTTPDEGAEVEFDILLEQGTLVRGEVRDWTTDEPLAGVQLRESMCERPVVTDALGRFDLRVLERRGHISLSLHRTGYSTLRLRYPTHKVPTERAVLRMPATLRVGGSVTTVEGDPIEDAWVYFAEDDDRRYALQDRSPLELPEYWSFPDFEDTTLKTDAKGTFEGSTTLLACRAAADVIASARGYVRARRELEGVFEPGERLRFDFQLERAVEKPKRPTGTLIGSLKINGAVLYGELYWKGRDPGGDRLAR